MGSTLPGRGALIRPEHEMVHMFRLLALLVPILPVACSDYSFSPDDEADPGDTGQEPDIELRPETFDFGVVELGESETTEITLSNTGDAALLVGSLSYDPSSGELSLDEQTDPNGEFPWRLGTGESLTVEVTYTPTDTQADEAVLTAESNDPDEHEATAVQMGEGKGFEGFSTGWYVFDDGIAYETTSNPDHVVDHHGDEDLYWYEPSGAHGLVGSEDPEGDFEILRQYVLDNAGDPVEVDGPFDYDGDSDLDTYEWATFTYFLCEFYLEEDADPSTYEISSGTVDDGIQVMVNAEILGRIELGESGSWTLENADPGQVNTLVIILVDDSRVDKYVHDLAFYHDGEMVEG